MEVIEVDFQVWQALTARRASKEVTENDVLRDLLGLNSAEKAEDGGPGWTWKGVNLPNGTELRAEYKGREYAAKIIRNEWIQGGEAMSSPSQAAYQITKGGVNGWTFWQAKTPGSNEWLMLSKIRSDEVWGQAMKKLIRYAERISQDYGSAHDKAMEEAVKSGEGSRPEMNHHFWSLRNWEAFIEVLTAGLVRDNSVAAENIRSILAEMENVLKDLLDRGLLESYRDRRWDPLFEY